MPQPEFGFRPSGGSLRQKVFDTERILSLRSRFHFGSSSRRGFFSSSTAPSSFSSAVTTIGLRADTEEVKSFYSDDSCAILQVAEGEEFDYEDLEFGYPVEEDEEELEDEYEQSRSAAAAAPAVAAAATAASGISVDCFRAETSTSRYSFRSTSSSTAAAAASGGLVLLPEAERSALGLKTNASNTRASKAGEAAGTGGIVLFDEQELAHFSTAAAP